jgi:hypothetical protein
MNYDNDVLRVQVRDSYATEESLAVYRKRVDSGLRIWEGAVVQNHFPARGRVLTITEVGPGANDPR